MTDSERASLSALVNAVRLVRDRASYLPHQKAHTVTEPNFDKLCLALAQVEHMVEQRP